MTTERRVAIVKTAGRADEFADAARGLGLVPVLVSPYRVERLADGEHALASSLAMQPAWVAVTSPHAAHALAQLKSQLASVQVAAVGQGTASALHAIGVTPAVVGDAGGAALAQAMLGAGLAKGALVVHPCAEEARRELTLTLAGAGVRVLAIPVYSLVRDAVGERAATGEFVAVVVGSPRLAQRAAELFPSRPPAVAIGRTTAAALRDLGWPPAAVAAQPTPADVADALRAALGRT